MSEPTQTCEVIMRWRIETTADVVEFCGKVAVRRYPAMGGGFMYLCLDHAKPHVKHSEPCYAGEES